VTRTVLVPPARVPRWLENFGTRHGAVELAVSGGCLRAAAADGAAASLRLPFGRRYDGPGAAADFVEAMTPPSDWGVLLVRKGGFAVARLADGAVVASKVGQRHVQGRTKAGGQSQQRFARRRANQARTAYEAAADHAARVLAPAGGGRHLAALVCGGDRGAVEEVLADPRLAGLPQLRVDPWLPVPDPRRAVLEQAVSDAGAAAVVIEDGEEHP
jgi:hypothetical protein